MLLFSYCWKLPFFFFMILISSFTVPVCSITLIFNSTLLIPANALLSVNSSVTSITIIGNAGLSSTAVFTLSLDSLCTQGLIGADPPTPLIINLVDVRVATIDIVGQPYGSTLANNPTADTAQCVAAMARSSCAARNMTFNIQHTTTPSNCGVLSNGLVVTQHRFRNLLLCSSTVTMSGLQDSSVTFDGLSASLNSHIAIVNSQCVATSVAGNFVLSSASSLTVSNIANRGTFEWLSGSSTFLSQGSQVFIESLALAKRDDLFFGIGTSLGASVVKFALQNGSSIVVDSNVCTDSCCAVTLQVTSLQLTNRSSLRVSQNQLSASGCSAQLSINPVQVVVNGGFLSMAGASEFSIVRNTLMCRSVSCLVFRGCIGCVSTLVTGSLVNISANAATLDDGVGDRIVDIQMGDSTLSAATAITESSVHVHSNAIRCTASTAAVRGVGGGLLLQIQSASVQLNNASISVRGNNVIISNVSLSASSVAPGSPLAPSAIAVLISSTVVASPDGTLVNISLNTVTMTSPAWVGSGQIATGSTVNGMVLAFVGSSAAVILQASYIVIQSNVVTVQSFSAAVHHSVLVAFPSSLVIQGAATQGLSIAQNVVSSSCNLGFDASLYAAFRAFFVCSGISLQLGTIASGRSGLAITSSGSSATISLNRVSVQAVYATVPNTVTVSATTTLASGIIICSLGPSSSSTARSVPAASVSISTGGVMSIDSNSVTSTSAPSCPTSSASPRPQPISIAGIWSHISAGLGISDRAIWSLSKNTVTLIASICSPTSATTGEILAAGIHLHARQDPYSLFTSLQVSREGLLRLVSNQVTVTSSGSVTAVKAFTYGVSLPSAAVVSDSGRIVVIGNVVAITHAFTPSAAVVTTMASGGGVVVLPSLQTAASAVDAAVVLRNLGLVRVDSNMITVSGKDAEGVIVIGGGASSATSSTMAPAPISILNGSALSISLNTITGSTVAASTFRSGLNVGGVSGYGGAIAVWTLSSISVQENRVTWMGATGDAIKLTAQCNFGTMSSSALAIISAAAASLGISASIASALQASCTSALGSSTVSLSLNSVTAAAGGISSAAVHWAGSVAYQAAPPGAGYGDSGLRHLFVSAASSVVLNNNDIQALGGIGISLDWAFSSSGLQYSVVEGQVSVGVNSTVDISSNTVAAPAGVGIAWIGNRGVYSYDVTTCETCCDGSGGSGGCSVCCSSTRYQGAMTAAVAVVNGGKVQVSLNYVTTGASGAPPLLLLSTYSTCSTLQPCTTTTTLSSGQWVIAGNSFVGSIVTSATNNLISFSRMCAVLPTCTSTTSTAAIVAASLSLVSSSTWTVSDNAVIMSSSLTTASSSLLHPLAISFSGSIQLFAGATMKVSHNTVSVRAPTAQSACFTIASSSMNLAAGSRVDFSRNRCFTSNGAAVLAYFSVTSISAPGASIRFSCDTVKGQLLKRSSSYVNAAAVRFANLPFGATYIPCTSISFSRTASPRSSITVIHVSQTKGAMKSSSIAATATVQLSKSTSLSLWERTRTHFVSESATGSTSQHVSTSATRSRTLSATRPSVTLRPTASTLMSSKSASLRINETQSPSQVNASHSISPTLPIAPSLTPQSTPSVSCDPIGRLATDSESESWFHWNRSAVLAASSAITIAEWLYSIQRSSVFPSRSDVLQWWPATGALQPFAVRFVVLQESLMSSRCLQSATCGTDMGRGIFVPEAALDSLRVENASVDTNIDGSSLFASGDAVVLIVSAVVIANDRKTTACNSSLGIPVAWMRIEAVGLSAAEQAVQNALAGGSIASLVLRTLISDASSELHMMVIAGMMGCSPRGPLQNGFGSLRVLAPLLIDDTLFSVIYSNVLLVGGAAGLQLFAAGCVHVIRKRGFNILLDNRNRPKPLLMAVFFPAFSVTLALSAFPGTLFAAIRILQLWAAPDTRPLTGAGSIGSHDSSVIAIVTSVFCVVLLLPAPFVVMWFISRVPRSYHRLVVSLHECKDALKPKLRIFSLFPFLEPEGVVLPMHTAKNYGPFLSSRLQNSFWALTVMLPGYISCVAAAVQFTTAHAFCVVVYVVFAIALLVLAVSILVFHPRRNRMLDRISALQSIVGTISICVIVSTLVWEGTSSDSILMIVLGVGQTVVSSLGTFASFVVALGFSIQKDRKAVMQLVWAIAPISGEAMRAERRLQRALEKRDARVALQDEIFFGSGLIDDQEPQPDISSRSTQLLPLSQVGVSEKEMPCLWSLHPLTEEDTTPSLTHLSFVEEMELNLLPISGHTTAAVESVFHQQPSLSSSPLEDGDGDNCEATELQRQSQPSHLVKSRESILLAI